MAFQAGISIEIVIHQGRLSLTVKVSNDLLKPDETIESYLEGLLGNMDGDHMNDLEDENMEPFEIETGLDKCRHLNEQMQSAILLGMHYFM